MQGRKSSAGRLVPKSAGEGRWALAASLKQRIGSAARLLLAIAVIFTMCIHITPEAVQASAGTADGTYHFGGSLGAHDSGGTGFKTYEDKFHVSNGFSQDGTAIWSDGQQAPNATGTLTIRAESNLVNETFTFNNLGISTYEPAGQSLESITVVLYDKNDSVLDTITSGPGRILNLSNSIVQLSTLLGQSPYNVANVAKLTLSWHYNNTMAPSNLNIENITISNIRTPADLGGLTLSSGALSPSFASGTIGYTANVANGVSSLMVTPTAVDSAASIRVNGTLVVSGSPSGAIPLAVGSNTVTVLVTGQNGTLTKTYTVTITRAASANADLSNLTLSSGTLSPAFASSTTSYTASVANGVSSLTVTPTAADGTASIQVNGSAAASGTASSSIPLSVGSNSVNVTVTAQNGTTTKTYTVTITRAASANADLSNLTLSSGTLSPAFASSTTSYTASVANGITSLTVTPTAAEPGTITVNGVAVGSGVASGPIALNVGNNTITVVVTAQNGTTTKTYTVTVTRAVSSDANLSGLTLSSGSLNPSFASGTTNYTANVANGVNSLTVTPTAAGSGAAITVNGAAVASGAASGAIALGVGSGNTVTVEVTAQDGTTTKTYTIDVTRAQSSNANLSGLTLSSGSLNPSFASGTTSYTVNVANGVNSLTVTPVSADGAASIQVNGTAVASGNASGSIPLTVGSGNTVTLLVTAQDGTTKTYTVTVTRAASTNADLSGLALSDGTLSPTFTSSTTSYTAGVPHSVSSMTVTPAAVDGTASIQVNGTTVASGAASSAIALNVGSNTVTVLVTAEDGTTTKTYTVTVTRAPSSNADLSGLALSDGTLSPSFASGTISYTANVANGVNSLTVTPTAADTQATITVNGVAVASGAASGAIALAVGSGNSVTVVVTAQDGTTTKTYTVAVTRAASSNADLSGLTLSDGTLSPSFASGTTSYTADTANSVNSLTVTPTAADSSATVKVNGSAVTSAIASAPISLTAGSASTVTILVTAQDGTTKTYTVTVTRAASSNADLSGLTLSDGTLSPSFASGTISYTADTANSVSTLTVTPTAADSGATVKVNGSTVASGSASGPISLTAGSGNTVTILVTAQDGTTTKTYTVTVTRAPSSNADLSGLTLSNGTLSPTFASGTATYTADTANSVSTLTVTPTAADSGATVKVNGTAVVSGSASGPITLAVGSGNTVTILVTAQDGTTTKTYTVTVTRAAAPSGGGSGSGGSQDEGDEVFINGKPVKLGKIVKTLVNGRWVSTLTVNRDKLSSLLQTEGRGAVVTLPFPAGSDEYTGQLTGGIVKDLLQREAVIVLQTPGASYTLPSSEMDLEALAAQLGDNVPQDDIKINITIAKPTDTAVQFVRDAAGLIQLKLVIPPVEFTVTAEYGGKSVEVTGFTGYVQRSILIPDDVDPKTVTTVAVVDPSGKIRHIPTRVVEKDGKYYAVFKSLSNSLYVLVSHEQSFGDTQGHWAEASIAGMSARMIVEGNGQGQFRPQAAITRAEFIAIIVRALGLKPVTSEAPFADVTAKDWFADEVQTAYENGLIEGDESGKLHPSNSITREQAMVIVARAMMITELEAGEVDVEGLLQPFGDADQASSWAIEAIAECLQSGLITGRSSEELAPQAKLTRAEVAVIIERLLINSDLI
ncbi:cadherin-like beta sandwich domain-containing protein [Paenibacillus sp. GCM10023252]|uniref:cadherin-like beta sandwich domain-containing protein n=1 Tax=Paenibacillus sp. GCM10023252 TaxID=3252649 RepID=UPI00360F80CD